MKVSQRCELSWTDLKLLHRLIVEQKAKGGERSDLANFLLIFSVQWWCQVQSHVRPREVSHVDS